MKYISKVLSFIFSYKQASPYNYSFWEDKGIWIKAINEQVRKYNLSYEAKIFLVDSINDNRWNVVKDFDGCTMKQDKIIPCAWCLGHDRMWKTGQGGYISDYIMLKLGIKMGEGKFKMWLIFLSVRFFWLIYFKWKHLFFRNVNKIDNNVITLYNRLRNE